MSKIQGTVQAISGGGGGVSDGDKGDVVVSSGATVWTVKSEVIDDRVAALLVAGANVTLTYNDAANTLTVAASGGGGGGASLTNVTLTVASSTLYSEIIVADASVSATSKILASFAPTLDAENDTEELTDSGIVLEAIAETGQIRFILAGEHRFVGPFPINYGVFT
jgi:hypothetical protein